jgi:hypothetical protein
MPVGTPGYDQVYEGTNYEGEPVRVVSTRAWKPMSRLT